MSKRRLAGVALAAAALAALVVYGYVRSRRAQQGEFDELLTQMPPGANAVLYINLEELRKSPFLGELYKWTPQPTTDADYAQFVRATDFNYENDLNRVAVAMVTHGENTTLFAIAAGRFDRKKISAYASQSGTHENRDGREIFSVPVSGSVHRVTFTFLSNDRMALTNDADLQAFLTKPRSDSDTDAWHERFRRLAGSPVFFVERPDGAAGSALNSANHSNLQSPELSALLNQLQWITVAGKPGGDRLRVVIEGESTADATARQLSEVLNGLLVVAQAGLGGPKVREQLQPEVREAYLEMLKSTDVSRIDRGETKAVRVIFDVTPQFLEAARSKPPAAPATPQNKPLQNKRTIRN
jgi:hypothetical protein